MVSPAFALPTEVAHWALDEGSGAAVGDSVSGYNGTFTNPGWVTGISGTAASFSDGAFIEVPNYSALDFGNADDFSISMWVLYPTAPAAENALLIKGTIPFVDGVSTGRRYVLFDKGGNMRVDLDDNATKSGLSVSDAPFVTGEWVNLVAVHDATAGTESIYANGVLQGSPADVAATGDWSNGEPLLIGSYPGPNNPSQAYIDDVRIFSGVLTTGDITEIMMIVPEPTSLALLGLGSLAFVVARRRRA